MTEDELICLLKKDPQEAFQHFRAMEKSVRRKLGSKVLRVKSKTNSLLLSGGGQLCNWESLDVALMACCTLSQLKKLRHQPFWFDDIVEVLQAFEIEFVEDWVNVILETSPGWDMSEVWKAGLCPRPTSDAYIMGHYTSARLFDWNSGDEIRKEFDQTFFEHDVWRFFEVEGFGEFSLAANDKYQQEYRTWQTRLLEYAEQGKLDRDRLLDASLDALSRDFAQFRAGWYSRFHEALTPTVDERVARTDAYLALLASTIPPTVSFAMKALKLIQKAEPIAPNLLLPALEPALQARQKSVITAALQLLSDTAKSAPDRSQEIACAACHALVSEDSAVQGKAIKFIEKLGMLDAPDVVATLDAYIPYLSPANKARFSALDVQVIETPIRRKSPEPLVPVDTPGEALAGFLEILEDASDPFKVELAFDGVARFGAELAADAKAMSPLKKRAGQLWKKDWFPNLTVVAARMWVDKASDVEILSQHAHPNIGTFHNYDFHERNRSVIELVTAGYALPMLSLPTNTAGYIDPNVLKDRLLAYRDGGVVPGAQDLDVALLRLSWRDAKRVLDNFIPENPAEQNFVYALGGELEIDPAQLLTSALDARFIRSARQGGPSDQVLTFDLDLFTEDKYAWFETSKEENEFSRMYAKLGKHQSSSWLHTSRSASAWHSILCPGFMEHYFRNTLVAGNIFYGYPDAAQLDPFFRPGENIGPIGATVLSLHLGEADKAIRSMAAEALVSLIDEGRIEITTFIKAFNRIFFNFQRPVKRFAESLRNVADSNGRCAEFVCDVIEGTMNFPPNEMPKNYGSLLELLYDLRLLHPSKLNDQSYQFLQSLNGGGKTAQFAKQLCQERSA